MGKTHILEELRAIKASMQPGGKLGLRSRFTPVGEALTARANGPSARRPSSCEGGLRAPLARLPLGARQEVEAFAFSGEHRGSQMLGHRGCTSCTSSTSARSRRRRRSTRPRGPPAPPGANAASRQAAARKRWRDDRDDAAHQPARLRAALAGDRAEHRRAAAARASSGCRSTRCCSATTRCCSTRRCFVRAARADQGQPVDEAAERRGAQGGDDQPDGDGAELAAAPRHVRRRAVDDSGSWACSTRPSARAAAAARAHDGRRPRANGALPSSRPSRPRTPCSR